MKAAAEGRVDLKLNENSTNVELKSFLTANFPLEEKLIAKVSSGKLSAASLRALILAPRSTWTGLKVVLTNDYDMDELTSSAFLEFMRGAYLGPEEATAVTKAAAESKIKVAKRKLGPTEDAVFQEGQDTFRGWKAGREDDNGVVTFRFNAGPKMARQLPFSFSCKSTDLMDSALLERKVVVLQPHLQFAIDNSTNICQVKGWQDQTTDEHRRLGQIRVKIPSTVTAEYAKLKNKLVDEARSASASRRLLLLDEPLDISDKACRPDFISQVSQLYQQSLSSLKAAKRKELAIGKHTTVQQLKAQEQEEVKRLIQEAERKIGLLQRRQQALLERHSSGDGESHKAELDAILGSITTIMRRRDSDQLAVEKKYLAILNRK
jgi:hypothetical protein